MTFLHSFLASTGTVTFFKGWDLHRPVQRRHPEAVHPAASGS
jgi:hypothetical protein